MRISIDSTEPLDKVLTTIGAVYGVTISATAMGAGQSEGLHVVKTTPISAARSTTMKKAPAKGTKATARKATRGRGAATNPEIRAWARSNGYNIRERGRIPADVVSDYRKSNG